MDMNSDNDDISIALLELITHYRVIVLVMTYAFMRSRRGRGRRGNNGEPRYRIKNKVTRQIEHMQELVGFKDGTCFDHLRMDRNTFAKLCYLLENIRGLVTSRHVQVSEQVAIFLYILGHHAKNRIMKAAFKRSGYTISVHFNTVLNALLKLYSILLVNPEPVLEDCTNGRWKSFKGCLGALDGTYIPVKVHKPDMLRYRNRKGNVSVNVLAACDRNMNYTYVLTGWGGSTADSRVLRDAITRPNGFKVPSGNYYLCDGGYTNGKGFLAPYRGVRYHLKEWDASGNGPQNHQEYFNLKHTKARNVIERSFAILKARWGILRSFSWYPIKTHNRIILACCLLHNFIRTSTDHDPLEDEFPDLYCEDDQPPPEDDFIDVVEPSEEWSNWRDNMATELYNDYISGL